jgi:hypothetical protein
MCRLGTSEGWRARYIDEVRVPDADKSRINAIRVAAMQTIRHNPRNVIPMSDPENQSLFRVEKITHIPLTVAPASAPGLTREF